MVDEASKVRLAGHTYACIIYNTSIFDTTRIAVGFVVARTGHVRFCCSDWGHLVVKIIQDGLVNFIALGNGRVGEETLNLFLEPGVGICKVAGWKCQSSDLWR